MNNQINKLNLLADNILLEPINPDIETKSGLISPTQYEDKSFAGKVIKVGNKAKQIKIGSIVYFNKYSTVNFIFDAKEYLIIRLEDIIAFSD